jgi:hypothetical protein
MMMPPPAGLARRDGGDGELRAHAAAERARRVRPARAVLRRSKCAAVVSDGGALSTGRLAGQARPGEMERADEIATQGGVWIIWQVAWADGSAGCRRGLLRTAARTAKVAVPS